MRDFYNNFLYLILGIILGATSFTVFTPNEVISTGVTFFVTLLAYLVFRETVTNKRPFEKSAVTIGANVLAVFIIGISFSVYAKFIHSLLSSPMIIWIVLVIPLFFVIMVFEMLLEFLNRYLTSK